MPEHIDPYVFERLCDKRQAEHVLHLRWSDNQGTSWRETSYDRCRNELNQKTQMQYATDQFDAARKEAQQNGAWNRWERLLEGVVEGEEGEKGCWGDVQFGNCSKDGVNKATA